MPDHGVYPAVVNVVTKSGTNQFHGEAFEFLRNGNLDARSFFSPGPEDLKRNQFGGAAGGPLWKDRAWFHVFYEGLREISAFSTAGYRPTQQMFGGNLAGTGHVIFDPLTYDPASGTRQPFPNNVIPPNQTGSADITPLPNRICDGRSDPLSGKIRSNGFLWFDTSCFGVPNVGYFGNSAPTVINGPGLNNWDVGVLKVFPLVRDSIKLQLRGELFNAWNHAQFGQPNGNAGAGPNFGRISASLPPRLIQVAAKVYW